MSMAGSAQKAGRLVILGVFAADLTFRSDRLPAIGETIAARGFSIGPGGKGSNQAIAAARSGGEVFLLTALGSDTFGDLARKAWRESGVRDDHVLVNPQRPTGTAFIFVSTSTGENAIIIESGAAGAVLPSDVEAYQPLIASASVFVTQLEQSLDVAHTGLSIARRNGVTTILNPAPAMQLPAEIYPLCDYLTPNESEAEHLTGIKVDDDASALRAAVELRRRGVGTVVITLGGRGALLLDAGGPTWFKPLSGVKVVDSSGAGDAFSGAFASELAFGRTVQDAIRFATVTAGLSVGKAGTASSVPYRDEVEARLPVYLEPAYASDTSFETLG